MKIYLGDISTEINENKTLKEVIHDQNLSSLNGLAVAINDVVIPKNKWENRTFSENDKVIIIKATAGG